MRRYGRLQDQTIGAFYGLVRETNQRVARLVSDVLGEPSKRSAESTHHAT